MSALRSLSASRGVPMHGTALERLRPDHIRRQLARIVSSAAFRDSLRRKRFLTFVVEATLAGKGNRIKSYTIAVEALDRRSDFDPQADAVVRVEAGRLRRALAHYYAGAGRDDPLNIELPRGSYVPTFGRRPRVAASPTAIAAHGASQDAALGTLANPDSQLSSTLAAFVELAELQRRQVALIADVIESARQTLVQSHALRGTNSPAVACRPAPPLLPTAPSLPTDAHENGGWPTSPTSPTGSSRDCLAALPTARPVKSRRRA